VPFNRVANYRRKIVGAAGWALDRNGRSTLDPRMRVLAALPGTGYAMAFMIDLLCGPLNGMPFGPHIPGCITSCPGGGGSSFLSRSIRTFRRRLECRRRGGADAREARCATRARRTRPCLLRRSGVSQRGRASTRESVEAGLRREIEAVSKRSESRSRGEARSTKRKLP